MPQELKFTQEVKDNWLEALKSGKFKQGFVTLHNAINDTYCCIGVLGEITEGLLCSEIDKTKSPYHFLRDTIGKEQTDLLWKTNDAKHRENTTRDYSNVIQLIETLQVQE